MVAYSSVSHMGVILLGIASMQPLGWAAALFMMFAHGIISPMLFAVCGAFKHHYHSMEIGAMRGMAKHSPWLATSMMFGWMASLGLPLLAGFVAELMLMVAYWYAPMDGGSSSQVLSLLLPLRTIFGPCSEPSSKVAKQHNLQKASMANRFQISTTQRRSLCFSSRPLPFSLVSCHGFSST